MSGARSKTKSVGVIITCQMSDYRWNEDDSWSPNDRVIGVKRVVDLRRGIVTSYVRRSRWVDSWFQTLREA